MKVLAQRGLQQALSGRATIRPAALLPLPSSCGRLASSLPTVAQQSFWKSLIPKPLRREKLAPDAAALRKRKSKDWNPATFYIIIFLLIGSMSIHMIALKRDFATFMRQSDVKIGQLRDIVERIQKGEDVDVERALGTGIPEKELEWEDLLREIERDDASRNQKKPDKKATEPAKAAHSVPPADESSSAGKTRRPANFF